MPRPRFHRLSPKEREQILDVASAAFAASGYERTSYNELLERLGLTKGSAYHMFQGKADLYAVVVERAMARLAALLPPPADPCTTASSLWPGVAAWIKASLDVARANPELGRLLGGLTAGIPIDLTPLSAPLLALIWHGRRVGGVRSDLDEQLLASLCLAVLGELDRATLLDAAVHANDTNAVVERYVDVLQRLLQP